MASDRQSASVYNALKIAAILGTVLWVSWSLYQYLVVSKAPGDYAYHAATKYFADGHYQQALSEYTKALAENPDYVPARRGQAETLIVLGREREAVAIYNELLEQQPDSSAFYANLGIAYDRLGEHQKALANYQKALSLDAEIGEGPGWLTRFLRNQSEKPPGITARAAYLRDQLALPESERVLSIPAIDQAQRPYKE